MASAYSGRFGPSARGGLVILPTKAYLTKLLSDWSKLTSRGKCEQRPHTCFDRAGSGINIRRFATSSRADCPFFGPHWRFLRGGYLHARGTSHSVALHRG